MSVQVHCDNCDESLGQFQPDPFGRDVYSPAGSVRIWIAPGDLQGRGDPRQFCDHLCLAKWAKRKASDE